LRFQFSTHSKDLKANNKKTLGYIAVEGADFLEGSFDKLEETYQDGVRSIQLVHYAPNEAWATCKLQMQILMGYLPLAKSLEKNNE
jgi:microsomal dipeptidase-like Zn-dependent dipeptidase